MAIYWVDPYIDAPIGGVHGTLDGTTRNGTYSYPFRATDIITSTTNITSINGVTLASGDEVRLKGLPSYYDFLVSSSPSTWYNTNYYTLRTNSYDANLTTKVASGTVAVFALLDIDTVPLINGPIMMFTGTHTAAVGTNNTVVATPAGGAGAFLSAMYKTSSDVDKMSLYLVDPQYYVANTYLNTGTSYFCNFSTDITVTDGWRSETERTGKTLFVINQSNTTVKTMYFNGTTNNTGWVLFDCPNTYFCVNNTTTASLGIQYQIYGANAATALYRGNTYTQKFGGFVSGASTQSFNYVGYYYSSGAGASTSCNNSEINIYLGYYPPVFYERYGLNTTHTMRNVLAYAYNSFLAWSGTYAKTANVGTILMYSGSTYSMIGNNAGLPAYTINLMDYAVYYCYSTGTTLFTDSTNPFNTTIVEGVSVENWTSGRLSPSKLTSGTTGPVAISAVVSFATPYMYSMKLNPNAWYDVVMIRPVVGTTSSTVAHANSFAVSLHQLDCEGVDYKSTNHKVLLGHTQYFYSAVTQLVADANIHFSLNSYDKKSIGFATSTSSNGGTFYGMMYYNEPDKGNALCFQSNANQTPNTQYTKLVEVTVPSYTTESIRIEVDLETSADWNTATAVYVYYRNASNATALATVKALSGSAITTKTTYSVTIPNASLSPLGVRHMQVQLRIYNGTTPSRKFYVHDVRATLV